MKSLIKFANWWNNAIITGEPVQVSKYYHTAMSRVLNKFLSYESSDTFRMSNMGKPLVELAFRKVKPKVENMTPSEMWVCAMGDYAEAIIIELMAIIGVTVTHIQAKCEWRNLVGHVDGVVDDTVFDIKCMSTTYFKSFTSKLNNDRGYLTQLSLYKLALGLPKAAFLCLDKTTGFMKVVKLPDSIFKEECLNIVRKLKVLKLIESEEDIYKSIKPPEPKRTKNGLVVPDCMMYSSYKSSIYGSEYHVDIEWFDKIWLTK